mmetsp:Transcript_413/g.467  ORF Transcript_413/g.467 Transcript_413/m.467 type:complete len:363 (-) Transcript_413:119-1207(-)
MGSLGSGKARLNFCQIQFHNITSEDGILLASIIGSEQSLITQVLLGIFHVFFRSTSLSQVVHTSGIDREESHGGSIFGGHVTDGGSVLERQLLDTGAEEFDELTNNTTLSEHLSAGQNQIGSSGSGRQLTSEIETNNLRQDHGDGLSEHDSFGFDTSNSPSGNTETVDHGGVTVSTDQGIGIQEVFVIENNSGKIFQVDLMDDTRSGRNDQEVIESVLAPFQEFESLIVSIEFDFFVLQVSIFGSGVINLDGVIDDQIDRAGGVNLIGISTQSGGGISHGGQIDDGGDTSEILQDNSSRLEGDFDILGVVLFPVQDVLNITTFDGKLITISQGAFQKNSDGVRQSLNTFVVESLQTVIMESV